MEEEKNIRINKVLRELNISLERAVDYLKDKGIAIEASPNTKISESVYNSLVNQFAGDKGNKEASKVISEEIRKEKEALLLEREREKESNPNNLPIEVELENKVKRSKKQHELVLNIINKTLSKFYLVYPSQSNNNSIWELKEPRKISINPVKIGDVLIFKSFFVNLNGEYFISISGIGIVTKLFPGKYSFSYDSLFFNRIDIKISNSNDYSDSVTIPSNDFLKKILLKLEVKDLEKINNALISFSNQNTEVKIEADEKYSNITILPGISSDSDDGEDYLDIKGDVNAFARVIAAKSFEPPLAIALLGKWGSGKSFFMRKLKEGIQTLSLENPEKQFCEGIAHVHFNAWSYMDANLWASIVTKIFEGLNEYINGDSLAEVNKKKIEKKLTQNLNFSKEEISSLEKQTKTINTQLFGLYRQKVNAKLELKKKVATIKQNTLEKILKNINEKFKVEKTIDKALAENTTFIKSTNELEKIIPKKYWVSPEELYNQSCSKYTFIKSFFKKGSWLRNTIWLFVILMIVYLTPIFTYTISLFASWKDFSFTAKTLSLIVILGNFWKRAIDTYNKLQPLIASFWKIKEDYESAKTEALFKFNQKEKALNIEILNSKENINRIDVQIFHIKEIKENIEFKLKSAISTEALYTFIEKRADSDDYKKHLGIVSLIRKDFEILSGLLIGHKTELNKNEDSDEFKNMFSKPLERIILYIDDLDRCHEERVVEVLEAVNLLMAFPLFVVVVGVDPRWVKTALQNKYENQFKKENESEDVISPSNYLEKIFQVPFHLKDAGDDSIKKMIKSLAQTKPQLETPKNNVDFDSNDFNSNDFSTGNYIEQKILDEKELKIGPLSPTYSLFNKETIEALDITEKECELMQDMSEIIGKNPRAIKRFVNIYRIVKTHEDFVYDEKENDLLIVMILLAISMGKYNRLLKHLEYFMKYTTSLSNKFSDFTSHTYYFEIDEKTQQLKNQLNTLLLKQNSRTLNTEIGTFIKQYQFIKRFTFKNI